MSTDYTSVIEQLYVAYFGRPAELAGLVQWQGWLSTHNGDVAGASAQFAASAEYQTTYAGLNNLQVIDTVYYNLFHRHASLAEQTSWGGLLADHTYTIDNIVLAVANGALNGDLVAITDKVKAATIFTHALVTPAQIASYHGDSAVAAAKAFIDSVYNDATFTAATAPAQLAISVASLSIPPVEVLPLTTLQDNIVPAEGYKVIEGSIGYVLATSAPTPTFSTGDQIHGTGTHNVINLNDNNTGSLVDLITGGYTLFPTSISGVSVSGIQTANVNANGAVVFNALGAQGWTGLQNLNITSRSTHGNTDKIIVGAGTAVTVFDTANLDAYSISGEFLHLGDNLTVTGGSSVAIIEDNGLSDNRDAKIIVNGGVGTTSVSVKQIVLDGGHDQNVVITDVNHDAGLSAGVINTVVIDGLKGGREVTINDSALTHLTVVDVVGSHSWSTPDVEIHNGAFWTAPQTLNLTVNNDTDFTLSNTSSRSNYTALAVTVGPDGATVDFEGFNNVVSETISGTGVLVQDPPHDTLSSLKTITVLDYAGFTDYDLYKLDSLQSVDATGSYGVIDVVLDDTHTTFHGGAGQDIVSIQNDAVKDIIGGSAGNNEIILNGEGSFVLPSSFEPGFIISDTWTVVNPGTFTLANTIKHVKNFNTLGVGELSSGVFYVDKVVGDPDVLLGAANNSVIDNLVVNGSTAHTVIFADVNAGVGLTFTGNDKEGVGVYTAYAEAADYTSLGHIAPTLDVTLNSSTAAEEIQVKWLSLADHAFKGITHVHIDSLGSPAQWHGANQIESLYDIGLKELTVTGTEGLKIGDLYDNATSLIIHNQLSSNDVVSGVVDIDLLKTPNVTSLTLDGEVKIHDFETDAVGVTVVAGNDNQNNYYSLQGSGDGTDTLTLGNGNNHVWDLHNTDTVNVTVGTGSNEINLGSSSNNIYLGLHSLDSGDADFISIGHGTFATVTPDSTHTVISALTKITTIDGINSAIFGHDTITFSADSTSISQQGVEVITSATIGIHEGLLGVDDSKIGYEVSAAFDALIANGHVVGEFVGLDGFTYLIENNYSAYSTYSAAAAGKFALDTVVKLTGLAGSITETSYIDTSHTLHLVG